MADPEGKTMHKLEQLEVWPGDGGVRIEDPYERKAMQRETRSARIPTHGDDLPADGPF